MVPGGKVAVKFHWEVGPDVQEWEQRRVGYILTGSIFIGNRSATVSVEAASAHFTRCDLVTKLQ